MILCPHRSQPAANDSAPVLPYAGQLHDPDRVRGDGLRRSLYFTMIAWIPGAFWAGAISGAPTFKLANYLGAVRITSWRSA